MNNFCSYSYTVFCYRRPNFHFFFFLVLLFLMFVHRDAARSEINDHEQTADDTEGLEEVVFEEVSKRFVGWNCPPSIVIKIEYA